jgi:flagellar biogenesis protein FliO
MMIISFYYSINENPEIAKQLELVQAESKETIFWAATIGMLIVALLVFGFLIWLFYKLIYGILLKRLNKNYKELKKLHM